MQFDENGMLIIPGQEPAAPVEAEGEAQATPTVSITAESEEGAGFLQEALRAVGGGARDAVQEMGNTLDYIGDKVVHGVTGGKDVYIAEGWNPEWLTEEEAMARDDIPAWQKNGLIGDEALVDLPEVADNETLVGGMARGITQFGVGYLTLGKQLKVGKGVLGATTGGAVADFAAFDAHEDRLSDFLRDNVGLQDPITEFLASDEDDTILEGKLKNAIEGAGVGLAAEGVMRLIKGFKKAKAVQAVDGDEAAAAVMNDEVTKAVDEGQLSLFDETTDPNLKPNDAAPEKVVKVGDNVTTEGGPTRGADPVPDAAPAVPAKPVDTSRLTEALNREIALNRGGALADPMRSIEGDAFNWDKMDADVDIKSVLQMATDAVDSSVVPQSTTLDEVVSEARGFLADSIDVDPDVIDQSLAAMAKNADQQRSMVVAGKALVQSLSAEVERLAYVIDAGGASKDTYEKFIRMQARLVETSGNLKATITGAAQATSAGRIRTSDWLSGQELSRADIIKQIDDNIANAGGSGALDDMARAVIANKATKGGPSGVFRIAEGAAGGQRIFNEMWINSILSGPKTHMINMISNSMNAAILPAEKIAGGALQGNTQLMREGARQYAGLAIAVKDSARAFWASLKAGRNFIDPEAAILEANGNSMQAIRSNSKNPYVRDLINGVGNVIRLPSRGLLASDEFFKQMNYRSSIYAELVGEASDLVQSGKLTKEAANKYVHDRLKTAFSGDGSARSKRHLEFAREATFTQELGRDGALAGLSRYIQDGTNKYPALKLVLPFVRTPSNIIKAALQRTPIVRRLSSTLNADLASGDPRRIASAQGKLATGSLMWSSAVMAAMNGTITGSGPKDPAQRKMLMETGWRPFSVKVGDKYIEYGRLDPFAIFFGMAADMAEIGGQMDDKTYGDVALAGLIAFTNNVTSKTYLQGLSDVMAALDDPERFMPSLLNSYASSSVPFSSLLREMRKQGDPAMREVRSTMDAIMNTLPGYSDDLPPRRSWITGEPIMYPKGWGQNTVSPLGEALAAANPITEGFDTNDPVLQELVSLNFGFSAPTRKINGVELDTEQYSRLLELHGTIRNGRYTMHQALGRLFEREQYKRMATDVSDPALDPRIKVVQRVIGGYRKAARAQLIKEYPELEQAIRSNTQTLSENARGRFSGIAELGQ